MLAGFLALFMFAQMPQPFAFMRSGVAGTPTPTPTPTATPSGTPTPTPGTTVATPVIAPSSGNTPLTVTISDTTAGVTIFYTLSAGGTNPTHSGGTPQGSTLIYNGSFNTGPGAKTVRALGYKAGMTDSAIASRFYDTPF